MNKNLRLFLSLSMFFTIFIFVFLYWLLTRSGESLVPVDTAIVFLIAMLFGAALAGILFCLLRIRTVGEILAGAVLDMNRRSVPGARVRKETLLEPRYYFRINEHNFDMRDAFSTITHAGVTRIAVDTDKSILVVGEQEELNKLQEYIKEHLFYGQIVSWFDNDRKVIKDARGLSVTLRASILQLAKQYFFPPAPFLIFHILNKPSYSQEDMDLIRGICERVGVLDVFIWNGRELTDDEIVTGDIPEDGWVGKKPAWKKEPKRA